MAEAPLSGWRVVDFSTGIAGGYTSKMLADGGATVVKIEPPTGDPWRRWSASGAPIAEGDDGALFQYLAASKQSVVVDPSNPADVDTAVALASAAEIIVWTPGSPVAGHPRLSPQALREAAPHAVVTAITPFGLDGPWAGKAATEFAVQGWAGGGGRGLPTEPPRLVGGQFGDWVAGMYAAIGVLASAHRSVQTGVGELLDVSMMEASAVCQSMHPMTFFTLAHRPFRAERTTNVPDIEPTKDGYVGFMVVTAQMWQDFCVMIEHPEWIEDESLFIYANRLKRREELLAKIAEWTTARTTEEVVELAGLFRLPVAPIGNGATIPTIEHFVDRHFYLKNPRSGFLQPDVPYTLSNGAARRDFEPAPRLGEHDPDLLTNFAALPTSDVANAAKLEGKVPELPLAGMRVADFTAFWAGPSVGHLLAILGADVIHVESIQRPDGMRGHTTKTGQDDQWWEYAPLFQGVNTNKRAVTINMDTEAGKDLARRLIAECDVLVDNYSPRVMESWGFGYEQVKAIRPDIIMVRMPAFGLSGPWRDRTGWAQTMEQLSGLSFITGYPDGPPTTVNGPMDPIAGGHATFALLLALEYQRRTGKGMLVEAIMVGGALNIAAEQVIEYSAYGNLLQRQGNHGPRAVPQNLYLCADILENGKQDRWIAVAVEDDEQWQGLVRALGAPAWASDPKLATVAGRRAAEAELDEQLSAWCRDRGSDDIVTALWDHGVPVAKVLQPHEMGDLAQLEHRHFYETVDHPLAGPSLHEGYPVRFSNGPHQLHRSHAPTLGEHNREVFCGLLGVTDEEFARLEADAVIGDRIEGSFRSR